MSDLSQRIADLAPEKRALLQQRLKQQGGAFNTFPLSFAQERLWFLDQLEPGSPLYTIPTMVRLNGALDVTALESALSELVQRHEVLRTIFTTVEGRPVQVVAAALELPLPVIDLCDHPEREREAAAMRLAEAEIQRPFDLSHGPLLRAMLLRLANDDHMLLLTMHHIASDGWSMGVLVRELIALYQAGVTGQPAQLPDLPLQYADYAVWQRKRLQGKLLERQLAYWRQQFAGAAPLLELVTDRPRPPVKTAQGATYGWSLPRPLAEALAALSQRQGATLFMTLLAAWKLLLARYSGQDDIVVGSPVAGRTRPDIEGLIGFFVNTLALRSDLSGNPTFRELLGRVRETTLGAYAHQDLPFERLVEALQPERDLRYTPLFQVVFALQNAPVPTLDLAGLTISPVSVSSQTAKFDLTLMMIETEQGLSGWFEYSTDLFDSATIAAMAARFHTLLAGIVADPDRRVDDLPLLTDVERETLLATWNATETPSRHDQTIHALFEAQVERTPDAVALVFAGWTNDERRTTSRDQGSGVSSEQLTYRELNSRANQLAHYLRAHGVGPEVRVGISLERSPELVIALLGVLKAGGAYVPLDPDYPAERLSFMLEDAQVGLLITATDDSPDTETRRQGDKEMTPLLVSRSPGLLVSPTIVNLAADWPTISQERDENLLDGATADNLAYVIYTSGSTGHPKGVMVGHRGVGNLAAAQIQAFNIRDDSRVLQFASPSFDASVSEIVTALLAGATLCIAPAEMLLPGRELLRLLREQAITTVTFPPSVLAALPDAALPALATIVAAGEACSAEVVARWGAGRRFLNAYGPTEGTVCATIAECSADQRRPPIGQPIANTRIYLLDRLRQPVPIGMPGELYIGGFGLARGYVGRPDLTAERFVPNPFAGDKQTSRQADKEPGDAAEPQSAICNLQSAIGDRIYKTGDLARCLPDGQIEFLGRVDHQMKVRGYRIEPGEIEAALHSHPEVREALVLVREDTPGDRRLAAYVVPHQGSGIRDQGSGSEDWETSRQGDKETIDDRRGTIYRALPTPDPRSLIPELRDHLGQTLPAYMIPSAFLLLEALPLTPSGKVDRRALPAPTGAQIAAAPRVAPQTELERTIAAIWQALLKIDVGREDNFFDLGGHSLLLVQVQHQLGAALGRAITIVDLFRYPTIRTLAGFLGGDRPAAADGLRPSYERAARRRALLTGSAQPAEALTVRSTPLSKASDTAIAIIGLSGRFPGAPDVATFWQNLCDGVESIARFSDQELLAAGISPAALADPNYVKAVGALEGIELFDAAFFGYSPREAEIMDPQQRLFLECAWAALEHAGYAPDATLVPTGVYAGVSLNHYWLNLSSNPDVVEALGGFHTVMSNDRDFLTTRVSYKLNLRGPSVNVQTACSTSLVAAHLACQALLHHECDLALAGGVSVAVPAKTGYLYHEDGISSPDGHCRTFDANAQGGVSGSGIGLVVLKRLADALADGDQIYAVIKGSAINNDGAQKVGYTAPSVDGQAAVIAEALALAEVAPDTVSYVEAHGTATALGDPIEVAALTQAFGTNVARTGFCALGAVKTNIGHLDAAAGVAGLIKTTLALQHGQLPPSLHYETPNPNIDFAHSPFYVNTTLSDWPSNGHPRRAGVSAFGLGGTNAHIVLEQAPALEPGSSSRPWQLLVLSAKTETALEAASKNLAAFLRQHPGLDLADVAYTLQAGRSAFRQRQMLVCTDLADALGTLERLDPKRVLSGCAAEQPSIVFLFPGLGAQYLHMGRELYQSEPLFREQVDRCAELLKPLLGLDIREVLYPTTNDERRTMNDESSPSSFVVRPSSDSGSVLDQTWLAQPALFVIAYALAQLWIGWGVRPMALLGYSIGEYVAACLAGVFSLEDALTLIVRRAQLIETLPEGAMLAVALGEAELEPLLSDQLSLTAINGPSLCVVGGPPSAVEALEQQLTTGGVATRRVQTTHALHSRMLVPIREAYAELVQSFTLQPPRIPYLSNVSGTWISAAEATDPHYWAAHMCQPVRFAESLAQIWQLPEPVLLEVGPNQGLGSLALQHPTSKGVDESVVVSSLRPAYERHSEQAGLLESLGRLWMAGASVDWQAFSAHERRHRVALPTYPFERQRYWVERRLGADGYVRHGPLHKKPDQDDWFYVPSWKRTGLPQPFEPGQQAERRSGWLLFLDTQGLGATLAQQLEQAGQDVVTVLAETKFARLGERSYALDPRQRTDYVALLADLGARGLRPARVVHFWSVGSSVDSFEQAQFRGFYSLIFLAQALDQHHDADPLEIMVVSSNMQAVTGEEQLIAEKATVLGPARVIAQEYPQITCRSIDTVLPPTRARQEQLASQLLAELTSGLSDPLVAYRGGYRWVQIFEPLAAGEVQVGRPRLQQGGVYLITGGLGYVGLTLADELARSAQAQLVLVGRSALPDRSLWEYWLAGHEEHDAISVKIRAIRALEERGATVLALSADVADHAQMQSVINQVQARFGALHGVIHAAGATGEQAFRAVHTLGPTESEWQFQAKVHGLQVLETVLAGQNLDFCILCSSLSPILGGLGFSAYAAANLFMDVFAHRHNQESPVPWISVNWEAWQPAAQQERRTRLGASLAELAITPQEGAAIFQRIIALPPTAQVIVSTGDLTTRFDQWSRRAGAQANLDAQPESGAERHPRRNIPTAYVAPRTELESRIVQIWENLLRITPVGIHDNFFDLGGHSLLGIQLISRLRAECQADVSLHTMFESPTVAELAASIAANPTPGDQVETLEEILQMVEHLSEDEVSTLLFGRQPDGDAAP